MKSIVCISPDEAQKILSTYKGKNKPDRQKVERFKRIILSGKWDAKRHTRIFIVNGELRNGKHRLTALVETGQTIPMKLQYEP